MVDREESEKRVNRGGGRDNQKNYEVIEGNRGSYCGSKKFPPVFALGNDLRSVWQHILFRQGKMKGSGRSSLAWDFLGFRCGVVTWK